MRGLTAAVFTGALALAAHAVAGGGLPSGGAAVMLGAVALVTGLGALVPQASRQTILVAVLAAGQVAGHTAMAAFSHSHGETSGPPWQFMLLTHAMAVLGGAALMSLAGHLRGALSRTVRRCITVLRAPVGPAREAGRSPNLTPRQQLSLLAASISHRGPPEGAHP